MASHRGHSKSMSPANHRLLIPPPPLSHFVTVCLDPPSPLATTQIVTNCDLKIILNKMWTIGPTFFCKVKLKGVTIWVVKRMRGSRQTVTKCDKGEGDQKSVVGQWHTFWMAPNFDIDYFYLMLDCQQLWKQRQQPFLCPFKVSPMGDRKIFYFFQV